MKRSNHKRNIIFVFVLIILISVMSISYALLSSSLSIGFNNVTQSGLTFDVAFDSAQVTPTVYGTGSSTCGKITPTANSVTASNVKLYYGDYCIYALKIKNNGNSKAILTSITNINSSLGGCSTTPGNFTCVNSNTGGSITYKICTTVDCNTVLPTESPYFVINTNSYKMVYFKISRGGNNDASQANYNSYSGGFKLNFSVY